VTAVALKGLLGRKLRSVLTGLAIVLGVAMISGTYILTDTINRAFTNVFNVSYRHADAIISGKQFVSGTRSASSVPASVLTRVRALPDVAAASGSYLFDTVTVVDRHGKTIASGGPSLGFGVDPSQPRFNPITLTSGHWAEGPRQVVIDTATAANQHYKVGDTIAAKGDGPIKSYTVVGLGKIGGVSIGGATLAAFDVPTAASILDKTGYDDISVAAKPGVSQTRLAAEIKPLLPPAAQVRTGGQQASHDAAKITANSSLIKYILLAFGAIALFVGAFVIFNTISITVAQRTRELATLRTLGASRRQVLRSVLLESFVIGLAASVVGLFAGLGLAKGLNALFVALGINLPQAGTVLAARTIIVSLLTGALVTLAAGLFPAIRATRVPPISAVREGAVPASPHAHRRPYVAGVVMLLGLAVIVQSLSASGAAESVLVPLGAGTLLLFIGVALVSSHVVRPLVSVVGRPARAFGGAAGRLAVANSIRNTTRTAATAAALMIGLALIAFVATLGDGLSNSVKDALGKQVKADYVLTPGSGGSDSFPTQTASALAGAYGVEVVSAVRSDHANVLGASTTVGGVDPATIGRVYRFAWKSGSDTALSHLGDGAIVDSSYATQHHLAVGSRFTLEAPNGTTRQESVIATYDPPRADPVLRSVVISQAAFDSTFPTPQDAQAFVNVAGGPAAAMTGELKRALSAYPDAKIQTRSGWVTAQSKSFNQVFDLFYVLLALSVIISVFGMINTLVLAVFERTRELGMLRAIGMSRRQMRRMIRHESIVTALIGAGLGLPLGVLLAALTTRALGSLGIAFHLPEQELAYFVVLAVVAGIGAAVLPARRAARLNVLHALQDE
jgi:putative ABC transport system permease protein